MDSTRRAFLKAAALAGAGAWAGGSLERTYGMTTALPARGPLAIASGNGLEAVKKAMEVMRTGADALDGVLAGVNIVEDDPNDTSVGYGGLPNENGVVELDAACMHGPTHRAGGVAALRNIKNPSNVARVVMERSDHVLLVAEGALRFARAHGFREENLLTDRAREIWLHWKETMSKDDDWLPPHTPADRDIGALIEPYVKHYGTIHCSGLDTHGNVSCTTTTSGLAFKMEGRVGDSPIIGAGLYCDNAIGSAGSTGRGEANMINAGSAMIVEWMGQGKTPAEACRAACTRIVDHNHMARLQTRDGRPNFDITYYALNTRGEFGGCTMYAGKKMAIHDGTEARLVLCDYLFEKRNTEP